MRLRSYKLQRLPLVWLLCVASHHDVVNEKDQYFHDAMYGNITGVMPEAVNDTLHLTPGELNGILLISDIEISRLARRGILPRIPSPTKSNSFLYPLVDCTREYIRHLKSAGQQDRDRYWKARAKSEKEKAHALSAANALRDGRLVSTLDVESKQRELAHTLKQRLAVIPGRIADALAVEIMRACVDRTTRVVVLRGASQIAKTECVLLNVWAYRTVFDPAPSMMVLPSQITARDFSHQRVEPLIETTPALKAVVSERGTGPRTQGASTIRFRTYPGGFLKLVGSLSASELSQMAIRDLYATELDRFAIETENAEGDPVHLMKLRQRTFEHTSKLIMECSADDCR